MSVNIHIAFIGSSETTVQMFNQCAVPRVGDETLVVNEAGESVLFGVVSRVRWRFRGADYTDGAKPAAEVYIQEST